MKLTMAEIRRRLHGKTVKYEFAKEAHLFDLGRIEDKGDGYQLCSKRGNRFFTEVDLTTDEMYELLTKGEVTKPHESGKLDIHITILK